jgi:hypothetical protein
MFDSEQHAHTLKKTRTKETPPGPFFRIRGGVVRSLREDRGNASATQNKRAVRDITRSDQAPREPKDPWTGKPVPLFPSF